MKIVVRKWVATAFGLRDRNYMTPLILHPDCADGPIHSVNAAIEATDGGCRALFRFDGDVSKIKVPGHTMSERMDDLWKTTCFEIFWQPRGGNNYREFNLSPSSRWACYDFDDFRVNSRNAPVDAISISCSHTGDQLLLEASIASELPLPADIALNAVVEDNDGNIQFWALAFAGGKPEFHSTVCRTISLGAV